MFALGDDATDEAVFREVSGRSLAIRVGKDTVATAARLRIASSEGGAEFLRTCSRAVRGDGAGP